MIQLSCLNGKRLKHMDADSDRAYFCEDFHDLRIATYIGEGFGDAEDPEERILNSLPDTIISPTRHASFRVTDV